MPLFGHNNNNNPATTTGTGGNVLHKGDPAYNNTTTGNQGHHGHTGPGAPAGAAAGALAGHHEGHTAVGAALGGAAGHHHAKNHPAPVQGTVPSGVHNANNMNAPGATTTGHNGAAIPASAGMQQGGSTAGAGEKAFVGKLEHAAGTILCSSTLKAKGLEKEREAQALKVQAAEIGAAERLEGEASARRERAVAHGAHPHHLGGGAGGGAPAGDTLGGGVGPTGYAGGATNANQLGGTGVGGAGGLGPQGGAGLR